MFYLTWVESVDLPLLLRFDPAGHRTISCMSSIIVSQVTVINQFDFPSSGSRNVKTSVQITLTFRWDEPVRLVSTQSVHSREDIHLLMFPVWWSEQSPPASSLFAKLTSAGCDTLISLEPIRVHRHRGPADHDEGDIGWISSNCSLLVVLSTEQWRTDSTQRKSETTKQWHEKFTMCGCDRKHPDRWRTDIINLFQTQICPQKHV